MNKKPLNADQIKIQLIDHLLQSYKVDLLVPEFSFYQGFRKADLVAAIDEKLIAFEIKSDRDKLNLLSDQMVDYSNTFIETYLITTPQHLTSARTMISKQIGILLLENNCFRLVRMAKERKRLSKHSLVINIAPQKIQKEFKIISKKKLRLSEQRDFISKELTTTYLIKLFYDDVFNKYYRNYRNFLTDRGEKTSITDLHFLKSG